MVGLELPQELELELAQELGARIAWLVGAGFLIFSASQDTRSST